MWPYSSGVISSDVILCRHPKLSQGFQKEIKREKKRGEKFNSSHKSGQDSKSELEFIRSTYCVTNYAYIVKYEIRNNL